MSTSKQQAKKTAAEDLEIEASVEKKITKKPPKKSLAAKSSEATETKETDETVEVETETILLLKKAKSPKQKSSGIVFHSRNRIT